jgi:hypothetical protein
MIGEIARERRNCKLAKFSTRLRNEIKNSTTEFIKS